MKTYSSLLRARAVLYYLSTQPSHMEEGSNELRKHILVPRYVSSIHEEPIQTTIFKS